MELTDFSVLGMSLFVVILFVVTFDTFTGRFGAPDADQQPKPEVDLPTV